MSLYVCVLESGSNLAILNATFFGNWVSYGNGWYFVYCNPGANVTVMAPGHNTNVFNSDSAYYSHVWLTKKIDTWSKSVGW